MPAYFGRLLSAGKLLKIKLVQQNCTFVIRLKRCRWDSNSLGKDERKLEAEPRLRNTGTLVGSSDPKDKMETPPLPTVTEAHGPPGPRNWTTRFEHLSTHFLSDPAQVI